MHARDTCGWSPLHLGVGESSVEIAALLIARGASVESTDDSGDMPLMAATINQESDMVRLLVDGGGALVDACDPDFYTPLIVAAGGPLTDDYREVMVALLDRNADCFRTTQAGLSPLGNVNAVVGADDPAKLLLGHALTESLRRYVVL